MRVQVININNIDSSFQIRDTERKEKMQSMKVEADRKRCLASGFLLEEMCKELGIANPKYGHFQNGKPCFANVENIEFNLSHSGEYAALAYCEGIMPIGVDIQKIRPMREGMKARILHEEEYVPEGLLEGEETIYLNRIWAIKESYVKMTGDGLRVDFRKIRIDFEKGSVESENRQPGYFVEWMGLPDYTMSICTMKAEQGGIEFVIQ